MQVKITATRMAMDRTKKGEQWALARARSGWNAHACLAAPDTVAERRDNPRAHRQVNATQTALRTRYSATGRRGNTAARCRVNEPQEHDAKQRARHKGSRMYECSCDLSMTHTSTDRGMARSC